MFNFLSGNVVRKLKNPKSYNMARTNSSKGFYSLPDEAVKVCDKVFFCTSVAVKMLNIQGRELFFIFAVFNFAHSDFTYIKNTDPRPWQGKIENCTDLDLADNDLGTCGCDGQLFINKDCTHGFYCDSTHDPDNHEGCQKTCELDQLLIPDFDQDAWVCVDNVDNRWTCPGEFNIECEGSATAIQPGLDKDDCTCDGELIVTPDCSEAFYCLTNDPDGGRHIDCPDNQILSINFTTFEWGCKDDDGQCPGAGGFRMGCGEGSLPVPICLYDDNPLGECECDGQLHINHDCTQGFYCDSQLNTDKEGCIRTCREDQILVPDFESGSWSCVYDPNDNILCPGSFKQSCPENPVEPGLDRSDCECDGELLVTGDCKEAFYCIERDADNGGRHISCGDTEILKVNLTTFEWGCFPDDGGCPGLGGFKLGCGQDAPPPNLDCESLGATDASYNPLGTCTCTEQIFVNADCSEGYWCANIEGDGCDIVSPARFHAMHIDILVFLEMPP